MTGRGMAAGAVVVLAAAAVAQLRVAVDQRSARRRLVHGGRRAPGGRGWSGRLRWEPPPAVARRLHAADLPVAPAEIWPAAVVIVAGALVAGTVVGGPGLGVLLASAVVGGSVAALWTGRDRADRRVEAALPELLEGVAAAMRGGATLHQALLEPSGAAAAGGGALHPDLAAVAADVRAGAPLAGALDAWAGRRPLPGVRLAVAALALGAEEGGATARAVDGVAATLRSRATVAAEVRALSSQARYSALVIALAPLAFGLLAAATDPRTAEFLFRTPVGLLCLGVGLLLDGVAAVWSHRLCELDA